MENENLYKSQVAELFDTINGIINEDMSPEKKSDEIMKALREEYILLPSSYINSFLYSAKQVSLFYELLLSLDWTNENERQNFITNGIYEDLLGKLNFSTKVTINPSRIVDKEYNRDVIKINGDSFGPFNPQEYFKPDNVRILWLLKEPLIKKASWIIKDDRGGNIQANDYSKWSVIVDDDNKTLMNLVHRTQTILNVITNNGHIASEEETMNHICILEVNHFHGLAFNGTDSDDNLIGQWAELNKDILRVMIDFYNPDIIIGGNTVRYFYSDVKDNYLDTLQRGLINGNNILQKIGIKVSSIVTPPKSNSYIASGILHYRSDQNKKIWVIDAYHPCPKRNKDYEYTEYIAKADAEYILAQQKHP